MSDPARPPATTTASDEWMLVVDDDEPICRLVTDMLEGYGTEVVSATSGAAALAALDGRRTEPVLVLTDVLMPGMDGLTLARKLGPRLKRAKIAIMSGHLTDASCWPVDLRELAFLPKPCRIADLRALVDTARVEFKRES